VIKDSMVRGCHFAPNPVPLQEVLMPARSPVSSRLALTAVAALALVSCTEPPYAPPAGPLYDAVKRWESNAAVYWNEVARDQVVANRSPAPFAIRGYAIVGIAQYQAAIAAEKGKAPGTQPSVHAAIAAASVAALTYLYPARAPELEAELLYFLAAPSWPGDRRGDIDAGLAIGSAAAAAVVARAQADNFFAPGAVTVPVGPGLWSSASPPVGALWGQARTWLLDSNDQFRPPPPPAFGSAEFLVALAEVRAISDTRTPEQAANAVFWDAPVGTTTPPGIWNELAASLAVQYRLGERDAAHLFALLNIVSFDGIVASHEAKFHYWLLRPSQADPLITTAIGLPNFPSYPANHATISGAMARILAHRFPAEKAWLEALAEEAAFSRVLGGIHYRFDGEAGLTLGRAIAEWAIANDVRGHEPFVFP
jgi:membrane-associated phospholipid phosphatase